MKNCNCKRKRFRPVLKVGDYFTFDMGGDLPHGMRMIIRIHDKYSAITLEGSSELSFNSVSELADYYINKSDSLSKIVPYHITNGDVIFRIDSNDNYY